MATKAKAKEKAGTVSEVLAELAPPAPEAGQEAPNPEGAAVLALDLAEEVSGGPEAKTPASEEAPRAEEPPAPAPASARGPGRPKGSKTRKAPAPDKAAPPASKAELRARIAELEAKAAGNAPTLEETAATLRPVLTLTFTSLFNLLAGFRGPHWAVDPSEALALGEAWAPVVAPYMDEMGQHLPLVSAVVVTASVVMPKLAADRESRMQPVEIAPVVSPTFRPEEVTAAPGDNL